MSERIDVPLGGGPVIVGGAGRVDEPRATGTSGGAAGSMAGSSSEPAADPRAAAAADATPPDTAAMRAEIRDTRDRVGDTLEQIGERLNPQHIKEQVKANVRDATIGRVEHMARHAADRVSETRSTIMDTIRENPIPAAMAGIGLGWLFLNRRKGSSDAPYPAVEYPAARTAFAGGSADYGSRASGGYADAYAAGGEETGTLDRARERAGELGRGVKDTAADLADRAQSAASDLADRTQDVAASVADQTRRQVRRVEDRFYDSPLGVGAATLALGLAAGLALPATDTEVGLVGDARDRVVDRARDLASQTKDKVQHVAERVMDESRGSAANAARAEGLPTP
jgi:ElaB/YqjD/DUF883 family membrane-anchored ribosome-binding protein